MLILGAFAIATCRATFKFWVISQAYTSFNVLIFAADKNGGIFVYNKAEPEMQNFETFEFQTAKYFIEMITVIFDWPFKLWPILNTWKSNHITN